MLDVVAEVEPKVVHKGKAYGRRSLPDMQSLEVVPAESSRGLNDVRYGVSMKYQRKMVRYPIVLCF